MGTARNNRNGNRTNTMPLCRVLAKKKKNEEGVVVLTSKHVCGVNTFFRPHQREVALESWKGGDPSLTVWLDPCFG